jgi:hypothetical protein
VSNIWSSGSVSNFTCCCGESFHVLWRHSMLLFIILSQALLWDSQLKYWCSLEVLENPYIEKYHPWAMRELLDKVLTLHPLVRQFEKTFWFSEDLKLLFLILHIAYSFFFPFLIFYVLLHSFLGLTAQINYLS